MKPLSSEEIFEIKECFKGLNVISVYDKELQHTKPISTEKYLKQEGKDYIT